MDRIDRLFRLHHLLDGRRTPVPQARICEELDCTPRTFHRIRDVLRDRFGAPIETVRDQGYRYEPDAPRPFELPGLWFSADELQALLILYRHLEGLEPGLLADQLAPLKKRVDQLMNDRRIGLEGLPDRIRFVSIGYRRGTPRHFSAIAEALLQRKAIHIAYHARSDGETTERTLDPQHLVHYRDAWYLDAWCRWRQALRTFSIDRIDRLERLDESAADIEADRLEAHYASAYGIFAGEPARTAVLRFTEYGARWAAATEWHPHQRERWLGDGRYELCIPYSKGEELIRDVLAYGPEASVVEPESLRRCVAQRLRDALANYPV